MVLRGIGPDFVHHLRAALAVGSVVTLLHAAGLLGWLDAVMLRMVSGAQPLVVTDARTAVADMPHVLLIGSKLYEEEFGQSSPLAPAKLAALLHSLMAHSTAVPATLVIDIDVSPSPLETADDPGRHALDLALDALLSRGTRVVLPLPIRASSSALQDKKFGWMQRLCMLNQPPSRGRLVFGLVEIVTNQGVVTQFDRTLPSLGMVATDSGERRSLCHLALAPDDRWKQALLSNDFDNRALGLSREKPLLRPFNSRFFAAATAQVNVLDSLELSAQQTARIAGASVFLGGAYSHQDRFITPFDGLQRSVEGAVLHAATFYSLQHPVSSVEGVLAFALDVVLGVLLGYCFSASWSWHHLCKLRARHFETMTAQLRPRLSLAFNVVLVVALIVLSLLLAHTLFYPLNLWINPGPIVIGVFAKSVLASHMAGGPHTDHDLGPLAPAVARLRFWDQVGLALLVGLALVVLISHH